MKNLLTPFFVIIITSLFIISSCKKSAVVKPASKATVVKLTNKQVAEILVAGLKSSFTSVKDVTGTEKTGTIGRPKTVNDFPGVPDGFCGLTEYAFGDYPADLDFPYFYDPAVDTLDLPITGSYQMFTICNDKGPYGYEVYRKMSIAGNGPGGFFFNDLEQNNTVKSLNANFSKFSLEGYMKLNDNWAYGKIETRDTTTYKPGVTFILNNGRPDLTGTATFSHIDYYVPDPFGPAIKSGYYGTYTFTGNFGVTVTFLQNGTPDVYHFTY